MKLTVKWCVFAEKINLNYIVISYHREIWLNVNINIQLIQRNRSTATHSKNTLPEMTFLTSSHFIQYAVYLVY